MFTNDYEEVQLEALTYLTGECNYGGRVTDNQDRRLIMSLLNSVFHKELLLTECFPLTESGIYCIPVVSSNNNNYLDHIKKFPLNAAPEVIFHYHHSINIYHGRFSDSMLMPISLKNNRKPINYSMGFY